MPPLSKPAHIFVLNTCPSVYLVELHLVTSRNFGLLQNVMTTRAYSRTSVYSYRKSNNSSFQVHNLRKHN